MTDKLKDNEELFKQFEDEMENRFGSYFSEIELGR